MDSYPERLKGTWLWEELRAVRNIRGAFRWGLFGGIAYSALDTYVLRGRAPWTLPVHADNETLVKAKDAPRIEYPKPDGKLTFDKLSSVFLSNTNHEEDQPAHLVLKDKTIPERVNLPEYDGPEKRYCTAGAYAYVEAAGKKRLQINAQNCVHCKTC